MKDRSRTDGSRRRVIFGIGPVRELLGAQGQTITAVWISRARHDRGERRESDPMAEIAELARGRRIPVEPRDVADLDEAAGPGAHHQGVVAVAGEYRYAELEDMVAAAREAAGRGLIVALDGVTDPHNLGAVVRSAYLFGAQGVVVPRDRSAPVTAAVTKASAGATEHLAIAQVTNLSRALEAMKAGGVWTAALASAPGALPIWQLDAAAPVCLVIGAEGSGIRPLVARTCDFQVEIPMAGRAVGSLNVSVAAGVALYEIVRQRSGDPRG